MAKIAEFYAELGLKKDKFDKGLKDAGAAPAKLGGAFKLLGATMAAAFSVAAILDFGKKSMAAYDAQAKAEAGLLTALKGRKDVQGALIEQANEMQRTTLFEDDTIIQAQKFLATMGLSATAIHDILPLLADFSTSTGMDLVQAANLAGKAIGTSTNALGRYGVELDATMSKTEKANEIMAVFTERYGNQAATAAKVGMSGLKQLNKAWGEIQEMIGKEIGPFLNAIATLLSEKMFDVTSDPKNDAVNKYLEATTQDREKLLAGYEFQVKEYVRLSKEWEKKQGRGAGSEYERYQVLADKVRETIAALKDLDKQGEVTAEGLDTVAAAVEKLPDPTDLATQSLFKYIDALETAKFALSDFLAVQQQQAMNTYSSGLTAPEDEPYVDDIPFDTSKIADAVAAVKEDYQYFIDDMNMMTEMFVEDFIGTIAGGIVDLITGDLTLDGFFNAMLSSIGKFLEQMGTALIAYGVAMDAFKKAFTNPWAAIAAGAALIVIGGVIGNLASAGPSTTGMSGGGSYGGGGGNYQPIQGNSDLTLRTEISGSDIAFVLERAQRTAQRNGRF